MELSHRDGHVNDSAELFVIGKQRRSPERSNMALLCMASRTTSDKWTESPSAVMNTWNFAQCWSSVWPVDVIDMVHCDGLAEEAFHCLSAFRQSGKMHLRKRRDTQRESQSGADRYRSPIPNKESTCEEVF
jgi:hypothetical protein